MKSCPGSIQIHRLIRSRRASIGLEVTPDARLIIRAPHSVSERTIKQTVSKKSGWILRKQREARIRLAEQPRRIFLPGEKYLYLGREYPLIQSDTQQADLKFIDNGFLVSRESIPRIQKLFLAWYRQRALKIFSERIIHFQQISGIHSRHLKISNARKRWGSCNGRGNLYLNWRLVMAPLEVIDYVVVHELVHIRERNHSRVFWRQVEALLPDYRVQRNWLKHRGHLLIL